MNGIYKNVESLEKKVEQLRLNVDKLNSYHEIDKMKEEDKSYFRGRTLDDIYRKNKLLNEKLKKEKRKRLEAEDKLKNKIKLINKLIKYYNIEMTKLIESNNNIKQIQKNLVKSTLSMNAH